MKKLAFLALGATLVSSAFASVLYSNTAENNYYFPTARTNGDLLNLSAAGNGNFLTFAYYNSNAVAGTFTAAIKVLNSDAAFNAANTTQVYSTNWTLPNDPAFSYTTWGALNNGADLALNANVIVGWKWSDAACGMLLCDAAAVGSSANTFWYDANGDDLYTAGEGGYWFGGTPNANYEVGIGRVGPKAIRIVQGADENGGIAELFFDDSAAFSLFNDSETLFAIFEVDLDTFSLAPTQLDFGFKYEVGRGGLAYNYKLFNFTTNAFVTIGGNVAATSWETVTYQNTTNADDFVDANGMVTARFSFGPINDEAPAQDGWLHEMEYCEAAAQ